MPGARGASGAGGPRGPPGDAGRAGEPGPAGLRVSPCSILFCESSKSQRHLKPKILMKGSWPKGSAATVQIKDNTYILMTE